MPGLSGIDVLRKVRADGGPRDLEVILLTAKSRDVDVDAGFATGASDDVIEPFSPSSCCTGSTRGGRDPGVSLHPLARAELLIGLACLALALVIVLSG